MTDLHATRAETIPALMASIQEYRALQQPLVDALRRIREDMDRASKSGDEWAMEWMGDVWNDLPLAVRAAGGDQDAAQELADQTRDTARQAAAQPAAAECAMPDFIDCGCNHLSGCQHPAPAVGLAAPTNHTTETEEDARHELYDYATITFHETGIPESVHAYVTRLIATYRTAILNSAADDLSALDPAEAALAGQHAWVDAANLLRRLAAGAES